MARIDAFLRHCVELGASDVHLRAGASPRIRIDGLLRPLRFRALSDHEVRRLVYEVLSAPHRESLERDLQLDFVYELPGVARFRAQAFAERSGLGAVFRAVPESPPTLESLGMPPQVASVAGCDHGLVFVAGPTGAGVSTTAAALVHEINRRSRRHILTIENPIEFVHPTEEGVVTQREIGSHTESYAAALRAALREAPDVIMTGQLLDAEAVELAHAAAEGGALVIACLPTPSVTRTLARVVDAAPADARGHVRGSLSVLLRGVIAQRLCPRRDGDGRIAAVELLVHNDAVARLVRSDRLEELDGYIQSSEARAAGCRSLEWSLAGLVEAGTVELETALAIANHPELLEALHKNRMGLGPDE